MSVSETATSVPGVRLPKDMPSNWSAREIVYARYTIDLTRPEGDRVVAQPCSYVVRDVSIEDFIKSRLKRHPLPERAATYEQAANDPEPKRPINIFVSEPCWVVIELDDLWDWCFKPNGPGLTTKVDHKSKNGALNHVLAGGATVGPNGPSTKDCRLVYFGVACRLDLEHQRFLCHVDTSRLGLRDDPIEPDIPNDGGRFPFPVDGTPCGDDA